MAKFAAGAAMLAGIVWVSTFLIFGPGTPPTYAAMLEPVARATDQVDAVHVVLRMLTREGEDFSYVNLEGKLSEVEAWIEWPRVPGDSGKARIDKPDRIQCFDGAETVSYHPGRNEAYRGSGSGIDLDLFWPAAWVRHMRNIPSPQVEVLMQEQTGGRGRLLLRQHGSPTASREPAFLGEFDRETEIEWDLKSHLLLGLRRWIYDGGERRLFSELVSIDYLPSIEEGVFEIDLPEDVRWGGVKEAPLELLDLGPREMARELFDAARRGDRNTVELLCPSPAVVDWLLEKQNRPTKVLFIGEPFRSGEYPGIYVPYKVRFGAEIKDHNLAVRNDNPQNRWVFDGGI
jgi:hypothetical protein